mgnify:CR=1 FL=1
MKEQTISFLLISAIIYTVSSCNNETKQQENGWKLEQQVTKEIDNLTFTFPASGHVFEKREALVQECIDAINSNCELLNLPNYKEPIKIRFVSSKEELFKLVGMAASGTSNYAGVLALTVGEVVTLAKQPTDTITCSGGGMSVTPIAFHW